MERLDASSDKLVGAAGQKTISYLNGSKTIDELDGLADKTATLTGQKYISSLLVTADKTVNLLGLKIIDALAGSKTISTMFGTTNTNVYLEGSEPDGFWHILLSATFITIDTTLITVDRN